MSKKNYFFNWPISGKIIIRTVRRRRVTKKHSREEQEKYLRHKKEALLFINKKLEEFNKYYNFKYNRVSIRNQRTRWGSCSRRGNLNFSYKLLFLPDDLANYIIIHELCHLKEFNHSKNFWNLVAKTIPDYLEKRKKLRKYNLA